MPLMSGPGVVNKTSRIGGDFQQTGNLIRIRRSAAWGQSTWPSWPQVYDCGTKVSRGP
jgi:hypothetical protein